ncbi:hypothetical protein LIER_32274 [Lithospermum erythrorhizon]|uniref:Gag1-like clamp domain-containing protein n=1 Tax=Lithospermum erythrorhizon TaxID=34254 RepID=A0AAV3RTE4_LITER
METNNGKYPPNDTPATEVSTALGETKRPVENKQGCQVFINHAAIAWHESRKKWIGNLSQKSDRVPKDPVISWSTTYEDLLSSNEPFPEPISLPEMVDFLVDIWYDEGLCD